jgi:hypothetical protein
VWIYLRKKGEEEDRRMLAERRVIPLLVTTIDRPEAIVVIVKCGRTIGHFTQVDVQKLCPSQQHNTGGLLS